jgi:hypothetical protein
MFNFWNKLASLKKERRKRFFDKTKQLSILSDELAKKKKQLYNIEYESLLKKQDEVFISLKDFLELMEVSDLSIGDILKRCRHISEFDSESSIVEIYCIPEDNHLVLCEDTKSCEKHKNYSGNKLRISSVRAT